MIKHPGASIHFTCLHVVSTCGSTILIMTVLLALRVELESPAETFAMIVKLIVLNACLVIHRN